MGSSSSPEEAPNNLQSVAKLKILDLISEGEIEGFWPKSGSEGANPLVSIYFDDVPILETDGTPNVNVSGQGFKFDYQLGSAYPNTTGMFEFRKAESVIPLPYSSRLFNPPAGKGDAKSVTVAFNTTSYPDADSARVTVRVPALYQQDNDGNTNTYQLSYSIDISTNDGAFTTVFSNTINGKCTSPYLKSHIVKLPKTSSARCDWKLKVRRTSENIINDSKTANDLYVEAISIVSSNEYYYPSSALVGFDINADQISAIPTRAYDVKGIKVRVPTGYIPVSYNEDNSVASGATYPGVWDGTFSDTKVWTNNPAWIYLDFITNKKYGLGNYFKEDWVDKWTLYSISQYCDELIDAGYTKNNNPAFEPRFTCNVSIQQKEDAFELINSLTSVFRSMSYWAGNIYLIQDGPKDPIFTYTNANVEEGNFSYSDSARNTRSTIVNVKWNDPRNLFREKIEMVEDPEGILKYGYIEKNINAFATTSQGQALRLGKWLLLSERLLTETINFKVGIEGLMVRPGDVFTVHDNFRTQQQQGGRISGVSSTTSVILDRSIMIDNAGAYTLSFVFPRENYDNPTQLTDSNQIGMIRNSQIQTFGVTNGVGSTNELVLDTTLDEADFPYISGAAWILSTTYKDAFKQSKQYKCINISEGENLKFDIIGLQYDKNIYDLIESEYTIETNPINYGDTSTVSAPTDLRAYVSTGTQISITALWTGVAGIDHYIISGKSPGADPVMLGTTTNNYFTAFPDTAGILQIWVGAVNTAGTESAFINKEIFISGGINPAGGPPETISITSNNTPDTAIVSYHGTPDARSVINWDYTSGDPKLGYLETSYVVIQNTSGTQLSAVDVGPDSRSYNVPYSAVSSTRAFDVAIVNLDGFGNWLTGAFTRLTDAPPIAPVSSTLNANQTNLFYDISADSADDDQESICIWYSQDIGFIPTFSNVNYFSNNFAGTITDTFPVGDTYAYFAIIDAFGSAGCPIYGPFTLTVV